MAQITITVDEKVMEQLTQAAESLGVTVDEAASTVINDYAHKELFRKVLEPELTKNAELYRRLARGPEGD